MGLLGVRSKDGSGNGGRVGAESVFEINHQDNLRIFGGSVSGKERMCVRCATASGGASLAGRSYSSRLRGVGHTVLHGMFQTSEHRSGEGSVAAAFLQGKVAIRGKQLQRSDLNAPVAQCLQLELTGAGGDAYASRNFRGSEPGDRGETGTAVYLFKFLRAELRGDGGEVRVAGVGNG